MSETRKVKPEDRCQHWGTYITKTDKVYKAQCSRRAEHKGAHTWLRIKEAHTGFEGMK